MEAKVRLYEAIEESARKKTPIQFCSWDFGKLKMVMISNTRFLVEDLYWVDDRGKIYCPMVEAGFENRQGLIVTGMYVCGNNCLSDGTGSGRTTMFRINRRYHGPTPVIGDICYEQI